MRFLFGVTSRLFGRLGQSQRLAPLLYASIGGLAAGLGTVALVKGLEETNRALFNGLEPQLPFGRWSIVPIVACGGLVAGLVVRVLGHESRGHGVPDVMFAFEHGGGKMPWRVTLSGALATLATIGAGGSAGQEGPSVHIGAGVASLVGSIMNLGQENRRLLVAVGAAGGFSAVFNAPLTGSFFALEVVLRRFTVRNFSTVVLGAVLANVVYRGILGNESALRSPSYDLGSGWQVFSYALLGVGTAVVAVAFVRTLYAVESLRTKARLGLLGPRWAARRGVLGVWHFAVIGTGTPQIASYLQGDSAARLLLLLVCLKLIATSLTLGSGGTGGVFMPSLFLGAAFGGAYGIAVGAVVPGLCRPDRRLRGRGHGGRVRCRGGSPDHVAAARGRSLPRLRAHRAGHGRRRDLHRCGAAHDAGNGLFGRTASLRRRFVVNVRWTAWKQCQWHRPTYRGGAASIRHDPCRSARRLRPDARRHPSGRRRRQGGRND